MRHSIRSQIFTGDHHNLLVVGTEGDEGQSADEVLRIHDAKLAKMGTDNLTRGAIDSYRKKHFGTADPLIPGTVSPPVPTPAPAAKAPEKPRPPTKPPEAPQKVPSATEQAAAAVRTCIKPPTPDEERQQHAAKLTRDLERLQADHDARVAQRQAAAQPAPTADDLASAITAEKQDAAAAQAEEVLAIESRVAGATERPHPDAKPEQAKAPAPQPAPSAPPTPEASTVATAPDAPQSAPSAPPKMGSGAVCEKCGAETTGSQAKLSQLFMSKTLCKECMDSPGGSA